MNVTFGYEYDLLCTILRLIERGKKRGEMEIVISLMVNNLSMFIIWIERVYEK